MGKKIYALLAAILFGTFAYAQVGSGSLQGKVTDKETGEPLPFVNVAIYKGDKQIKGTTSDFDGKFTIKPVDPGKYDIQASFVGYTSYKVTGVVVGANRITFQDLKLTSGITIAEFEVVEYKKPLITKDGGATGGTVTAEEINKMPTRSATGIASTVGGVSSAGTGGGLSIRGGRSDGDFYYIDGVKVRGSSSLPKSALQEVNVITGGVPANYGDATGGIVSITTRGPASTFSGSLEAITSGFKVGDNQVNLLDKFGSNILEGAISGPLYRKRLEDGSKGESKIGYRLSVNYSANADGRRSIIGHNVLTDDARQGLIANPLSRIQGSANGVNYNSSYIHNEDIKNIPSSQNTSSNSLSAQTKLTFDVGGNADLAVGGSLFYQRNNAYSLGNQFANSDLNALNTTLDYRGYVRLSQRLLNDPEGESLVKNLYYSLMLDYSKSYFRTESETLGDNYFAYGHNGYYEAYKDTFQYALSFINLNGDSIFERTAVPGDTLITFQASDFNPLSANYADAYFSLYNDPEGRYDSFDNINGFRNGDGPNTIYGFFNNIGMPVGTYGYRDNNQYRVSASGSADVGNHAVTLGFEFEQRIDKLWQIQNLVGNENNRNNNVWTVMRSRANSHTRELFNNFIVQTDADGNPLDTIYPTPDTTTIGQARYVNYDTRVDLANQSYFDRNMRIALGMDPNGDDFLNIDAVDPTKISIDYFSPDELLNNGSRLVVNRGFDVYGNNLGYQPTVEDYFTKLDANGNFERPVDAFKPVYAAGYLMDKFSFDDIIFNVGLRVDRYDANQSVLKDQYLFRDTYTAGDLRNNATGLDLGAVPAGMGDDYYVYVDDIKEPTKVLGYRDGNTIYDASGQVTNANAIRTTTSEIAPFLKDRDDDSDVNADAFEDYKAQINVMPRVAFSFPISDVALFFAHYDVLTRRPVSNNVLDLYRYNFIRTTGSSATNTISNPNLLPEKTVDYAMGFQQAVSKSAALKLELFYREMRDQIQVFQYVGAYPQDYYSYDNLDFGTVKGLTAEFDLRATGNVTLNVNYTLQFADGTGSNAGGAVVGLNNTDFSTLRTISPLNYDQRHKFNARVDFRYGSGKNYNGPVINGKQVLSNFGANAVFNVGSGTPYSASSNPNQRVLQGTINGSRLPWQNTVNLVIDKTWDLAKKTEDKDLTQRGMSLNVFLLVNNLFNTLNITGVYPATGQPDDDGYLNDPRFRNLIDAQIDTEAYTAIRQTSNLNPGNYGAPRTIQIGARLDF